MSVQWINPAALFALTAVSGPILIHLLRRQRATPLPFPTLRFVVRRQAPAFRPASPSDLRLLALRVAIVAAAAIAWAQPVIVTDAGRLLRQRSTGRAVVVDDSPSVTDHGERMREVAAAERAGVARSFEIPARDLRSGLRAALTALDGSATARRELVVISDFQLGAISARDLAMVPEEVGLRFVPVGRSPDGRRADVGPVRIPPERLMLGAPSVSATVQTIALVGDRTRVVLAPSGRSVGGPRLSAAPDDQSQLDSLMRTLATAGTPALPDDRSVALVFQGGTLPSAISPPRDRWMGQAILRMRQDRRLLEASQAAPAEGMADRTGWVAVTSDVQGRPVTAAAALGSELVIFVNARPADYLAAAAAGAALVAAAERPSWSEHEPELIPDGTLQAWSRPPSTGSESRWLPAPPGDARWFWGLALLLLIAELFVRRRSAGRVAEERAPRAA